MAGPRARFSLPPADAPPVPAPPAASAPAAPRTKAERKALEQETQEAIDAPLDDRTQSAPVQAAKDHVKGRNLRDLGMLGLGVASLGIVGYDFFYRSTLTPAQIVALELLDLAIVAVFAAEFVWRWSGERWKPGFVARNWFDVLGMVPMMVTNIPVFRAFRLLRIGMVASRLLRMWAFVSGQKSAQLVFDRYRAQLVEQVTDRVMLSTLDMVQDVAARGGYVRALGDSLHQQRHDIAAAVLQGTRAGTTGKVVAAVPGAERAIREAVLATVDSLVVTLRSAEMQRTFEASVKAILDEARQELGRERWRELAAVPAPPPLPAEPAAPRR